MSDEALIGVDLGGSNVRVGKVEGNRVIRRAARKISGHGSEQAVLDEIFATIDEVFDDQITGIGCGVPSVVDVEHGIVFTVENIPSWREVHLGAALEARYQRPVTINNDANAFAVGELYFGKARGRSNVVAFTLGTGLGGGIIIKGRLYAGSNCGAGEIGMIPWRDRTIEHYAAGQFFRDAAGVGGEVIFARALAGDAAAAALFHEYGRQLGFAVMTALYAFDPEMVVFGGSISRAFGLFEAGLRERLAEFAYPRSLKKLVIASSELEDAAILGAAALYLDGATRQA
jgi:glucokinase